MLTPSRVILTGFLLAAFVGSACGQHDHGSRSPAAPHATPPPSKKSAAETKSAMPAAHAPLLPEGMTLDEVLDYAANPPPPEFPHPVMDKELLAFVLIEQLEYRIAEDGVKDELGWEVQGWIGRDYNRFWWKNDGEASFEGGDEGESENDLLYSRLISPFWHLQAGVQYANEWDEDDYDDRWSGVIAIEGLAPYKFEIDSSLYISEDADVTLQIEAEYDLRITQQLVLQPRTELNFAFQDIPDRMLGEGLTDVNLDLRLRYEIKREIAPYFGIRYRLLVGETHSISEAEGDETEQFYFLVGARLAF